jgi:hypothetical protein
MVEAPEQHQQCHEPSTGGFKGIPAQIACSLKRSAERSPGRKGAPFQSAMAMLNFYIDRAGRHIRKGQRQRVEARPEPPRHAVH